jgi:hypothetical protein
MNMRWDRVIWIVTEMALLQAQADRMAQKEIQDKKMRG